MKGLFKVSLLFMLTFSALSASAQTEDAKGSSGHTFVKLAKLDKFYTKDELNKLPKLTLIDIYKSRLSYLIEVLPFLALNPAPGATFHDMSIPETEANIAHLDKEAKNKEVFIKSLEDTMDDVVPYSEKTNIVWSILFFEEMIKKSDYTAVKK